MLIFIFYKTRWFHFIVLYFTLSFLLILKIKNINTKNLNNIILKSTFFTISLFLILLNLAGLPPSSGFIIKLIVIKTFIYQNFIFMITALILVSALSFFFYSRIFFSFITNQISFKPFPNFNYINL